MLDRGLPERGVVQSQTLANGTLCILDFPIYTIGGKVYETQRKIGDERLKAQALLQFGVEIRFRCYNHIRDFVSARYPLIQSGLGDVMFEEDLDRTAQFNP
jgi:hypothetical protein